MSVIATIAVPSSSFSLGSLVERTGVTVRVETTVPTSESVFPYLWVPAEAAEPVLAALEENPAIGGASVVDESGSNVLVELTWTAADVDGILRSIQVSDAIVTSAAGTADRWTFRLRFPSYEDLSTFYAHCRDAEIDLELVQLHEAVVGDDASQFGLTDSQRSLIVAAHEAGYFDVPRRTTLVELGERLEVSDSAVSQRLRRGLTALIDSTVGLEANADSGSGVRSDDRGTGSPDRALETERDARR